MGLPIGAMVGGEVGATVGKGVGATGGKGDCMRVWARVGKNGNIVTKIAGVNDRPRR